MPADEGDHEAQSQSRWVETKAPHRVPDTKATLSPWEPCLCKSISLNSLWSNNSVFGAILPSSFTCFLPFLPPPFCGIWRLPALPGPPRHWDTQTLPTPKTVPVQVALAQQLWWLFLWYYYKRVILKGSRDSNNIVGCFAHGQTNNTNIRLFSVICKCMSWLFQKS